jgi:hypothetical protein
MSRINVEADGFVGLHLAFEAAGVGMALAIGRFPFFSWDKERRTIGQVSFG